MARCGGGGDGRAAAYIEYAAVVARGTCVAWLVYAGVARADSAPMDAEGHKVRQIPIEESTPFNAVVTYTADSVTDLSGGLDAGTGFISLLQVGGGVNGAAIGLPAGSRFEISALRIDSQDPSLHRIDDVQVASNIEAPSAMRISQFWYLQDLPAVPLRTWLGLLDLNQYLDVTESATTLINSSFGITPVISGNAPASLYPKPGYGAMVRWERGDAALHVGIFQGNPGMRHTVLHDGRMLIGEWQPLGAVDEDSSIRLKLGAWQCHCRTGPAAGDLLQAWGGYGSAQVTLGRHAGEPVVAFVHLAGSPSSDSVSPFAAAAGLTLSSPIGQRPDDHFSLGMTRMNLRDLAAETSYEMTYILELRNDVYLQPDIQYITKPSGALPDAWVFTLRINLEFDTHFQSPGAPRQ
jgi:porin